LKYIQQKSSEPNKGQFYNVYIINPRSNKTLYFIGPYKGKKYYFYFFFLGMVRRGYRIFYLQPHNDVLSTKHLEWLGKAILQATEIIQKDRGNKNGQSYLAGVSLGSYLSLNIILNQRFEKFAGIDGGAPLAQIFRTAYLFRKDREIIKKAGRQAEISDQWHRFDDAFTSEQLKGVDILLVNSKNDSIVRPKSLAEFVEALSKTGANVINDQKGYLPHILKSLSLNFLANKIHKFFRS